MNKVMPLSLVIAGMLTGACGLEGPDLGRSGTGGETFAITNSEGEDTILRQGTSVNLSTPDDVALDPDTIYHVKVINLRTGAVLAQTDLLTDMSGSLERTTVAHDIGEFDDVADSDTLNIIVADSTNQTVADRDVKITPHVPDFQGHGFQIDEVQPPHIYSADRDGKPVNSFVVGAMPDPDEIAAPIYAVGKGFPAGVTQVDLYVVRDADAWQGKAIPRSGSADHLAGPVTGTVDRGVLKATDLRWRPTGKDLGPYDILVDVDRDGQFDYTFSSKDAADGEDKVGLTVQYSAAWLRAKMATDAARTSTAAASKAYKAADAAATKAEGLAKGSDAIAKAAKARTSANKAKAAHAAASGATSTAATSFNQTLADDVTCAAQAKVADAAAKNAASFAAAAAQLVNDTAQATLAYEAKMKAMAAQIESRHLIVNLAFDSSSRSGKWTNSYTRKSTIYSYVNPPVQKGSRHAWVAKLVVKHQSWSGFWNNPERMVQGGKGVARIYIKDKVVKALGGTIQKSCTNSPPVKIINPGPLPVDTVGILKYDIVFDYDNDGYYDIGRDFIDVVSTTSAGALVSARDLSKLTDDQIFGFQVTK